jgi:hypothetical protein
MNDARRAGRAMAVENRKSAVCHKVTDGDSLKKLAQSNDLTWQELALFNWGTEVPEEINAFLYFVVGCRKPLGEAPFSDTGNYVFSSQDGSLGTGEILIPKKFKSAGLALDTTHVLRVKTPQPKPLVTELTWVGGKKEIHPLYYPENNDQKIALTVKVLNIPEDSDGSAFDIKLLAYTEKPPDEGDDNRKPVELPLSMLGITGPADLKVSGNVLKSMRPPARPALELRLDWDEVTTTDGKKVFPSEMHGFQVTVGLAGAAAEETRQSEELKRAVPVVIFANADAVESQKRFWESGQNIRDDARGAGHLALLEAGRTPGKPSVFVSGTSRGKIPAAIPMKHMRGSSHAFYRGHGFLYTKDGKSPCRSCKFRDRYKTLDQDDKLTYLGNTLQPLIWKGGGWKPLTWTKLKQHITAGDSKFIKFEVDESRGDKNFKPQSTPGNFPWFNRIGSMISGLLKWNLDQVRHGLEFCMPNPSIAWVRVAVQTKLNVAYSIPVDSTAANGPSFHSAGGYLKTAPDVVSEAPPGTEVPADTPIYVNSISNKCEQGEDVENKRGGFIFWETTDGKTFAESGGKPVMCFDPTDLGVDEIKGLKGTQPTPTELMYASGCLTAATDDLAQEFLKKGTRIYIGNRIVAWGSWNRQMAEAFSKKVFDDGKTPEAAFNDLKGEYVGKLRCVMWRKKDDGGTEYVDE